MNYYNQIVTIAKINDIDSSQMELLKVLNAIQSKVKGNKLISALPKVENNKFAVYLFDNDTDETSKLFEWSAFHTLEGQEEQVFESIYKNIK